MPRIKDIIIDSILSVRKKMNPNNRKNIFELFGFDFLLDEEFRLWLLEINTNPFLGTPCAAMKILVPEMMEDLVQIVVDPVNKPENTPTRNENKFELIYREKNLVSSVKPINHRRPFDIDLCYPIIELKPLIGKLYNYKTI
jgi:hypothetical protein